MFRVSRDADTRPLIRRSTMGTQSGGWDWPALIVAVAMTTVVALCATATVSGLARFDDGAAAQRGATAPVPVEQEPHHALVFSNSVISVLDVQLPPGYVSLFHVHAHDNISVRIATGPT